MKRKDQIKIIAILKDLVAINSSYPPGNSTQLNNYIFNYLKGAKLNVSLKGPHKNKLSLIAKNYNGKQKSIVFNSHIDTVQPNKKDWITDPFTLTKKGNYLHGLGAVNCKGSAAVHVYLASQL